MKRTLLALALILALIIPAQAQEKEEKLKELEKLEQQTEKAAPPDTLILEAEEEIVTPEAEEEILAPEAEDEIVAEEEWDEYAEDDTSRVRIGEIVTVEETDDETVIRIGKRAIRILSEDDNTEIWYEEDEETEDPGRRGRSFNGHLGGIELGFNSFSTDRWGSNDGTIEGYLDLNTGKSTNFNIIAPPVNLGFTRHFGIVTSLGISFNNYRFDGNNSLGVADGMVTPLYPSTGITYEKSKLATVYGVLPVMLEVQIPVSHRSTINLGAGVIGAVKLGSHTKTVYRDDGKQKDKSRDDFNLNVLRYGVTARAGYEMIQVYGTCYLSPMFEKNKGPELYPFEVGIALTIND